MAILNAEQFMAEFGFRDYAEVDKQIKAGMPYTVSGKYGMQFNTAECQEWFLHGWFDSLSEKDQRRKRNKAYELQRKQTKEKEPCSAATEDKAQV